MKINRVSEGGENAVELYLLYTHQKGDEKW